MSSGPCETTVPDPCSPLTLSDRTCSMLLQQGDEWVNKYDLSSLRVLGTVGEPINPEAWHW